MNLIVKGKSPWRVFRIRRLISSGPTSDASEDADGPGRSEAKELGDPASLLPMQFKDPARFGEHGSSGYDASL